MTIDDILLPGTPESVRQGYLSLADRAEVTSFGLLEDDVVVLDTETTGLSFRDCGLIEISAARMRGREVVDRFETFVDPGSPIPPEITRLTHITDLDVQGAPKAREAVADLAAFVGGLPVIAHNAAFDRTFVERVPGGREVSSTWIDSLALSRIALPRLATHRLASMAEAFGCAAVTHRSSDDVDALCGMWRIILCALTDLPKGLLGMLADMHPEVEWAYRPILSQLALADAGTRFSLKATRSDILDETSSPAREDVAERTEAVDVPMRQEIVEEFHPGGTVARMYEEFEARPEQVQMAVEVRNALATSTNRSIEAGTGVGKSIAYLLPEVLYARRNNVTVGVATKSNALTDQLVSHELPALARVIPGGLTYTSLKGYDHYPCLHRLDRAVRDELPLGLVPGENVSAATASAEMLTAIAVTYAFASQSPEGDIDALGIRWRFVPRRMLTTTPGECLRNRCPYFSKGCLLHGARRRAAGSDVVVTNHSLLLRNVSADGHILPPIRDWVIDEAHAFEAEARRQWAVEVRGDDARTGFEVLGSVRTGAIHAAMVGATALEGSTTTLALLTRAASAASRAQVATGDFLAEVHGLVSLAPGGGGYDAVTLWIDDSVRATPEWGRVADACEVAVNAIRETDRLVGEAAENIAGANPQLAADLREAGCFLGELMVGMRLIGTGTDDSYVYSAQLYRSDRRVAQESLSAEKIDVGTDLANRWLPEMRSVVFTSATIAVGEDFTHFNHAVGLDRTEPSTHSDLRLDSSFDYDSCMSVIVAKDLPSPYDRNYLPALEDLLFDIHVAMGGSVLTLFTNRRDMERVFAGLQPRLAEVGLDVACQERGSSPRRIRERFMAEKSLSLMALKSFWEGFDATGDTLRCVVIPKLPFASPTDPLVRERDRREERAWWKYSLPEAVIAVKQAAGRLIRTGSDTGVLVLADSRLVEKSYGRTFVNSLPSRNCTTLGCANVRGFIELWRGSHER